MKCKNKSTCLEFQRKPKFEFNKYAVLSLVITFAFLSLTVSMYLGVFERLFESVKDLCTSFGYYLSTMFHIGWDITPTVTQMPELAPGETLPFLPVNMDIFGVKMSMFVNSLITAENFGRFISGGMSGLLGALIWVQMLLPAVIGIYCIFKKSIYKQQAEMLEDTKALKAWKRVSKALYAPLKGFIVGYIDFHRCHGFIVKLWLFIWAFHFNLITVAAGAIAYAFYFICSFDFINLYVQLYKLFIDISGIPWWVWVPVILTVFVKWRLKRGYKRLNHMENKDKGFINSLPIVTMICGAMGLGKNNLAVDMALSQSEMFRDEASEHIQKINLYFPNFPWLVLEWEIQYAIDNGDIWNLASCRVWVDAREAEFFKIPSRETCFGYDFMTYGMEYNDKLVIHELWETIKTYAQLYSMYSMDTSLLVSNYSVREDDFSVSKGNFPRRIYDFFKSDPEDMDDISHYAHILDFDILRLGKKVKVNNPRAGSLEWGILLMSEVGKERGNSPELKEVKKDAEEANQKNDYLNWWLKMCRHAATVDHYPFIKIFTDEQRPESWGADARDLCYILTILEKSEIRLAMPGFRLESMCYDFIFSKFIKMYSQYRFERGDNSLFVHIVKTVVSKFEHYYQGIYNRFGYRVMTLETEKGTQDGEKVLHEYYLMTKKIFAKRYASDCFGDFFAEMALKTKSGLLEYPEYASEKATLAEMVSCNGYFMNNLMKLRETSVSENRPEEENKEAPSAVEDKKRGAKERR